MRSLDIDLVEKELNVKLPRFFVEFHFQKAELIRELRIISKDADYIKVSSDADWMIEHNRDFLKLPKESGICRNKICIGTDGCGNDAFISLLDNDERVFFIDHESASELIDNEIQDFKWDDEQMEKYSSIEEYVKYCIGIYKLVFNEER